MERQIGSRGWLVPLASLFAVLVLLLMRPTDPVRGADPGSMFAFESDPGDPVGRGHAVMATTPTWTVTTWAGSDGNAPSIQLDGPDGMWLVSVAGAAGAPLVAGTTYRMRLPGDGVSEAVFMATWFGSEFGGGCGPDVDGQLVVHDVGYVSGAFSRLSATFHVTCSGAAGSLAGEIRYNVLAPAFAAVEQRPLYKPWQLFDQTTVGEASGKRTFTLTSVGTRPLVIGTGAGVGALPEDLRIVDDGCSGSTLDPGTSCTFGLRFTPTDKGERRPRVAFPTNTRLGQRALMAVASAVMPTTTTIEGPAEMVWESAVFTVTVRPAPSGPGGPYVAAVRVEGFPDHFGFADLDETGQGSVRISLSPGDQRVWAEFGGPDHVASQSEKLTVHVGTTTSVAVGSDRPMAESSREVTITAHVLPADATFTGGTLTLRDTTTDELLGSIDVAPGQATIEVTRRFTAGGHNLRASYTGHGAFSPSEGEFQQAIQLDRVVEAGVEIGPARFYPYKDRYLDEVRISGGRDEVVGVAVAIRSVTSGTVVRTFVMAPAKGKIRLSWNGLTDAGTRAPAGRYDVKVTMTDQQPNTDTTTRRVTLSWDHIVWTAHTAVLDGRAFVLVTKAHGGSVNTGASGYPGGVKLTSGNGAAGVQYRFRVSTGVAYQTLSFAVLGRSPNGHKAALGIWDPDLGGYRSTDSYNAARVVGPSYAWWTTSTDMGGRVRDGAVRAVVMVGKGLGGSGSSMFDIRDVRITYRTGVLKATTAAELDAMPAELRDEDAVLARTHDRRIDALAGHAMARARFTWPRMVVAD